MRDFICVFLFVVLALGCGRREQESAGETAPPSRLPVSGSVDVRLSEEEKIEALIRALGDLPGAIFVRNGQEHTAVEAMQHLRDKWAWKKSEIHSAEDFIRVT
ncbi:DUF5329 family protein, partial [bacterium]|nr:DUF5329 family protein [bacterium]